MNIPAPMKTELQTLLGEAYPAWRAMRVQVEALYDMELVWATSAKLGGYDLRYRRGGKTLCTLCARANAAACMIVFGAQERDKAEPLLGALPDWAREAYATATTYHDGKWVWFELRDTAAPAALEPLLRLKRRPNRA